MKGIPKLYLFNHQLLFMCGFGPIMVLPIISMIAVPPPAPFQQFPNAQCVHAGPQVQRRGGADIYKFKNITEKNSRTKKT